jgi:hypothetical protein
MAETEVLVLLVEVLDHIQDNIVLVLAAVPLLMVLVEAVGLVVETVVMDNLSHLLRIL